MLVAGLRVVMRGVIGRVTDEDVGDGMLDLLDKLECRQDGQQHEQRDESHRQ